MVSGGNAHDRRRMRRLLERLRETYGYGSEANSKTETTQSLEDFLLKYVAVACGFLAFGYELCEFSPTVASVLFLLALAVFLRGFWPWCNTRRSVRALRVIALFAALAFLWFDGNWIRKEWSPTFLLIVPTHDLVDCERRAFFIDHVGFKRLQNVRIIIKDNKSGDVTEDDDFTTGIEPGSQSPDAPRYIWVKPSRPWDEDYTITVTGTRFRSVQELVLRSDGDNLHFAAQVKVDPDDKPVVSCRDSLLPDSYSLGLGSRDNCDTLMATDAGWLSHLHPEPYGLQRPNGDFTIVRLRKLPTPSELESQSDDRHVTEYEQSIMRAKLSKYRGTKVLILYAGGSKTLAYAMEFRDFLTSLQWNVAAPRLVPAGDEGLVDVQVSISYKYWSISYPTATDFLNSLEGIKHRRRLNYDDAIPMNQVILWVGPKSPDNFTPDDCAAAELHPRPGQPHTCEMVVQTTSVCRFIPQ
jgi:hypothetical protein